MKQLLQTCGAFVLNYLRWFRMDFYCIVFDSLTVESQTRRSNVHLRREQVNRSFFARWLPTRLALLVGLTLGVLGNLQAQNCTIKDYLYLNDQELKATHKFLLSPNGSATEIYSSGTNQWLPPGKGGITWSPHGLGQDLNGNIYIGQDPGGPIAKFKSDGTLVNPSFINDGGFNFVSRDGYVYVNSTGIASGTFNNRITRYSLCDGSEAGYIILANVSSSPFPTSGFRTGPFTDWGLQIDKDGTFYVNAGTNVPDGTSRHTYIYRFKPTESQWTSSHPTITGFDLGTGPLAPGMSTDIQVWGIATDQYGQIYMVIEDSDSFNGGGFYTWILKYSANFVLKGRDYTKIYGSNPTPSQIGSYQGGRGIIYYAPWDEMLIAGGKNGDCISRFEPHTMTYLGALEGNVPGQTPKTLRVASEACPTLPNLTVDTTLCNAKVGDIIFLQNIIGKCDAPISEGTWSTRSGTTGVTFNQCDLSFTITNVTNGCGKFTLSNVGGSCGSFNINVNVDFGNVVAPVLSGDLTVCESTTPPPITINSAASSTGTKPIKYQWQKSTTSCTSGFTNISGATASTYTPSKLNQTTYFRVVTTVDGSCSTPFGTCSDTSNCVTYTTKVCCPNGNCYPSAVVKN